MTKSLSTVDRPGFSTFLIQASRSSLRVPATMAKVATTITRKLFRQSDYGRWQDPDNCLAWWSSRTERIAHLIQPGSRVLEFGAGRRQLESLLPEGCSYVSSDLVDRGAGTIVCDLNQRPLPDLKHISAQIAVFAGVLEYLNDLNAVIRWLSDQVANCIVSYDCVKSKSVTPRRVAELLRRAGNGYLSYYTEDELIALFKRYGFICTTIESWRDQKLLVFAKVANGQL